MSSEAILTLKHMATARFSSLSEAEKRLLHAVLVGQTAFCGVAEDENDPSYEPANDPADSANWHAERDLRVDLLRWICVNREALPSIDPRGIQVCAARIQGKLDLSFATIPFPLSFNRCVFNEDVNLSYLKVPHLEFAGCRVKAVNADGCSVAGDLSFCDGFISDGGVRLLTAQIGGNLDANGGEFLHPAGHAFWADRVKVSGSVFLGRSQRDGRSDITFRAEGTVRLVGAQLGGVLSCAGGKFQQPHLVIPTTTVAPSATTTTPGANPSPPTFALICDRIKAGQIFLSDQFSAIGAVRFWGADIGINLICSGGSFCDPGGTALSTDGSKIGGGAYFDKGFVALGAVDLLNCQIGGDLDCTTGTFSKLRLGQSVVKGALLWTDVKDPNTVELDMRNASVGPLRDEERSWPSAGKLSLDGFCYSRFSRPAPTSVESRLRWLELCGQFTLQPYQQLAKVLKEAGDAEAAPLVLFQMEHRHRRSEDKGILRKAKSWILRWSIGYGQIPMRALWWLLALVIIGSGVYGFAYLGGIMSPSDKDAYAEFKKKGYPPDSCPPFNPLVYSAEHSFPVINLELKDRWRVGSEPIAVKPTVNWAVLRSVQKTGLALNSPIALRVWMWTQTVAGWVLATLFVAGLSGIVKSG